MLDTRTAVITRMPTGSTGAGSAAGSAADRDLPGHPWVEGAAVLVRTGGGELHLPRVALLQRARGQRLLIVEGDVVGRAPGVRPLDDVALLHGDRGRVEGQLGCGGDVGRRRSEPGALSLASRGGDGGGGQRRRH